jgi:subtilase family serine protease
MLNYPAGSKYTVGGGGTVLYFNGHTAGTKASRVAEYSWNFTGGGASDFMKAGKYQGSELLTDCVTKPDGSAYTPALPPCRGIPDVAAQSGDVASNGYTITVDGANDSSGGGTSLSSPLWVGMWARIQAASTAPKGLGFANPSIYRVMHEGGAHLADFFDIGGGASSPPNCNGPNAAINCSKPGWDYVSGWGTPDVAKLMLDLTGRTKPSHPTSVAGPPTTKPKLNPCGPVFTHAAGGDSFLGQTGQNPQLSIVRGDLALSTDGQSLITTLTIANLSTTVPAGGGANEYYFLWNYNGTQYFSQVEVDPTGTITYGDGSISGNTYSSRSSGPADTGSFTPGPNGTITVNVPLAVVGGPNLGDVLVAPNGQSKVLVGTTQTGGLLEPADQAGPNYDYKLGQSCP